MDIILCLSQYYSSIIIFHPTVRIEFHLNCSDKVLIGVEAVSSIIDIIQDSVNINLVSEGTSDTTEALDELETFLSFIRNKLNFAAVVLVVDEKPVTEWLLGNYVQICSSLSVLEVLWVLCLSWGEVESSLLAVLGWVGNLVPGDFDLVIEE